MKQCGRVVKIEGSRLTVFPDGARCAGCSGGHCHLSHRTVQVSNSEGLPVRLSDRVEITSSLGRGLLDFFLLIPLPLAGALLAAFPGAALLRLEGPGVRALLALCAAGLLLGANLLRSRESRERTLPQVTAVLSEESAAAPEQELSEGA